MLPERNLFEFPFLDLRLPYQELKAELDAAYERVMRSGRFILGEEVEAFEAEFANYCGSKYCVALASGLDALHLILKAYGIGDGDEVIVPANTYIATWLAVSQAGAKPVPVEPSSNTYNIDCNSIAKALTPRTRAVIAVHLYGQPASMDEVRGLGQEHGLIIIEDAAQAHGARFSGTPAGSLSNAAAFSFYPTKNLGAFGDAGAVVTNDDAIAQRIQILRNYGSPQKNINTVRGCNSRLDPIQAAFLRVRLPHLDAWNLRRKDLAELYLRELHAVPELDLPFVPDWAEPAWHQFVIQHKRRDDLRDHLAGQGIETAIHYPIPPHLSGAYSDHSFPGRDFTRTQELANTVLSLPMNPHLQPQQAQSVISAIQDFSG